MKKRESSVRSDLLKKPAQNNSDPQHREQTDIHPDVLAISGIVPAEIDAELEYRDHLGKHS